MLRNGGFFLMRISDRRMLLLWVVAALLGRGCDCEEAVLAGETGRSSVAADGIVVGLIEAVE